MVLLFVPLVTELEVPVSVVTLVSELPRSISFLAHPANKAAAASKQIIFFISRNCSFPSSGTPSPNRPRPQWGQLRTYPFENPSPGGGPPYFFLLHFHPARLHI